MRHDGMLKDRGRIGCAGVAVRYVCREAIINKAPGGWLLEKHNALDATCHCHTAVGGTWYVVLYVCHVVHATWIKQGKVDGSRQSTALPPRLITVG